MEQKDLEQLKKNLAAAGLLEGELKLLDKMLPVLGSEVLQFLDTQAGSPLFPALCHVVFRVINDSYEALELLKKGDSESAIKYIGGALESPAWQFGKWALPLVMDIKRHQATGKISVDPQLDAAMTRLEIGLLQNLPDTELRSLFGYHLIETAKGAELLRELKNLYLTKEYTGGNRWAADLLFAVENNEEMLGSAPLLTEGKKVPPQIKNWIRDYIVSVPRSPSARTTFDEIQYIHSSPHAGQLKAEEKNVLLEILKIHSWLIRPEAFEYSEQEQPENLLRPQAAVQAAPPPVPVRFPGAGPKQPMGDIGGVPVKSKTADIDKKLEELKKKVR